jgi:hypothetical protein
MKNGLADASVKKVKSENADRSNRWFDRPQAGAKRTGAQTSASTQRL